MKLLAAKHPDWIMRGCIGHGLALAMKDFTQHTAGKGANAKQNTWGCKWAESTLASANKIANFFNDSPQAKCLVRLQPAMQTRFGLVTRVTVCAHELVLLFKLQRTAGFVTQQHTVLLVAVRHSAVVFHFT